MIQNVDIWIYMSCIMISKIVQASFNSHKKKHHKKIPLWASFWDLNHSGPEIVLKKDIEILGES